MIDVSGAAIARPIRRTAGRSPWSMVLVYGLLAIGATGMLLPFAWLVSSALKDPSYLFLFPPQWTPLPLSRITSAEAWGEFLRPANVTEVFTGTVPFGLYLSNSVGISLFAVLGQVASASIVGFSFARLRWSGRGPLFVVLLATMMLPTQVTIIPTFVIFRDLGWLNTWLPLIVPTFFGVGGALYIFLMRQFFMTLPLDLDDAAKIDGCGVLGVYARILVPLALPTHGTVAILSFVYHWNDYFHPLIYLTDSRSFTAAIGLRMFRDYNNIQWHTTMAASVITLLPIVLVFFVAQRYFIQGIVFTGVKG